MKANNWLVEEEHKIELTSKKRSIDKRVYMCVSVCMQQQHKKLPNLKIGYRTEHRVLIGKNEYR